MNATLKQRAYDHIRDKLMRGDLSPGEKLSHRALAREIGISFIPVREAISQLASEGLVDHRPGLGTFVMSITRREMREVYDLRAALECHAAEQAAGRMTAADLDLMRSHNRQLRAIVRQLEQAGQGKAGWTDERLDGWMVADAALHLALLRAADNRRAIKVVSDLRIMTYIFGHRVGMWPLDSLLRTCDEHDRLIEALRANEPEVARSVMAEHIRSGCEEVLNSFQLSPEDRSDSDSFTVNYPAMLRDRIARMEEDSASISDVPPG